MGNIGEILFWIPLSVLLLAVLGVVWSPASALICVLVARLRKLDGESYGTAGAKLSMLLILPWVYLLVKMLFGRSLPAIVVVPVYVLIYSIWLVIYVAAFNVGGLIWSILDVVVTNSQPLASVVLFFVALGVMLPFNVYTLNGSIRNLRQRYTADKELTHRPMPTAPHGDYLAPFIWLIGWSLVVLLITIVAGLSAYAGT